VKKFLVFLLIIGIAPVIAGIYGILHDQLTYSISNEYYTKFKFIQFGFIDKGDEAILPDPRLSVAMVGFLATWWMGVPIGIILALVGLIHKDSKQMLKVTIKAFAITILVAFLTGLLGLIYGKYYLADTNVNWWFPENLIDKESFISVGSMHNFSYLGGLVGLIVAIIYSVRQKYLIQMRVLEKEANQL
jgi:hypothetical protein